MPKIEQDLLKVKGSDGQWHYVPAVGGNVGSTTWDEVQNKPFSTLGDGLSVDEDGVLSAQGGNGGSPNAVQYVYQELTKEQKAQARMNIEASPIPKVAYWLSPHYPDLNLNKLYSIGTGYGIVTNGDETVPAGMTAPMLVIFGRMAYGRVDITVYDGAGVVWNGSFNMMEQTTDVTKTGDYVTNSALTEILKDYVLREEWIDVLKVIEQEVNTKLNSNQGADNAGKILGVGEDGTVELQKQLKVFDWANANLPFTADQISNISSGAGFVTNPTNFADGKTYFRYKCNATNFTWTNPNPQKGAVTITLLGWRESDKNYEGTVDRLRFVYSDGTVDYKAANEFKNGVKRTYTTDGNKTLVQIRGNNSYENWVLLDMDVMSIVADYAAPSGTSITVDSVLSDTSENPVQNKVIKAELDKKIETVPSAGANVVGGIKADVATAEDTQDVRIGADGKLKTKPTGGSTVTVDSELSSTSVNPVQNKVVTAALAEKITAPSTAAVGQIIKVKSVDSAGKPTEWEAAEMASGEKPWKKVIDVDVTEPTSEFNANNLNGATELHIRWSSLQNASDNNYGLNVAVNGTVIGGYDVAAIVAKQGIISYGWTYCRFNGLFWMISRSGGTTVSDNKARCAMYTVCTLAENVGTANTVKIKSHPAGAPITGKLEVWVR